LYIPSGSVPYISPPNTESERETVKFINLTPHSVDVYIHGEKVISIPPSGIVLRAPLVKSEVKNINGIPVYSIEYHLPDLPEPQKNTIYIVSSTVLQVMKMHDISREDIIAPDTSDPIRDKQGKIVGVKGFIVMR